MGLDFLKKLDNTLIFYIFVLNNIAKVILGFNETGFLCFGFKKQQTIS